MVDRVDVVVHPAAQGSSWKNQDETGEAEMRYNITQDGEAVEIHVQDAGERAPQARVTPGVPGGTVRLPDRPVRSAREH
jgi:hypothetical protein